MNTGNGVLRLVSLIPPSRACGACDACCTALAVEELKKPPGRRCQYSKHSSSGCCSIYSRRPSSCAKYECGWLIGFLGSDMRPDRSGLLLEPLTTDDMTLILVTETVSGAVARNEPTVRAAVQPGVCFIVQQKLESGVQTSLWSHPADKARAEVLCADLLSGRATLVFSDRVVQPKEML